jgi:hypothetical protein
MEERRKDRRTPVSVRVKIIHPSFGTVICIAKNLSNGGMLIDTGGVDFPDVGAEMQAQALDTEMETPLIKTKIIRKHHNSVALGFV